MCTILVLMRVLDINTNILNIHLENLLDRQTENQMSVVYLASSDKNREPVV